MVAVAPFSHRLAFHDLPDEIQRLRCKVNFEALRFVPSIDRMGNILVERLRKSQSRNVGGDDGYYKYLALHLRFDKVTRKRQLFISVNSIFTSAVQMGVLLCWYISVRLWTTFFATILCKYLMRRLVNILEHCW